MTPPQGSKSAIAHVSRLQLLHVLSGTLLLCQVLRCPPLLHVWSRVVQSRDVHLLSGILVPRCQVSHVRSRDFSAPDNSSTAVVYLQWYW